jgi:hypothetical protein
MTEKGGFQVNDNVLRKYLAELLGTFALVFFGAGSAVIAGKYIGFLGIAFAFGVIVKEYVRNSIFSFPSWFFQYQLIVEGHIRQHEFY